MVRRACLTTSVACLLLAPAVLAAEPGPDRLDACYAYDGGDGRVWLCQPIASLDTRTAAKSTRGYRLAPELASELAPLVTRVASAPPDQAFHGILPRLKSGQDPVGLNAKTKEN